MERRTRAGSHLVLRGEIWHYRRVVPVERRPAFGCSEVVRSLGTTSRVEAERLEKPHDVEFEARLRQAREISDPHAVAIKIADSVPVEVGTIRGYRQANMRLAEAPLTDEGRALANELIGQRIELRQAHQGDILKLLSEIGDLLTPLSPEALQQCRANILAIVRHQVGARAAISSSAGTQGPQPPILAAAITTTEPLTLEWAYSRWLRTGGRTAESVDTGRRHFNAFVDATNIIMLDQIRRSHLVAWRDSLIDKGELAINSINQRLQFVSAILRAGWRDAEMAEQNLKAIILPDQDDNDRGSWNRQEILDALKALEPRSWSAWVYLIGLTTGVRMGEPMAARVDWFDPQTSMIEVRDRSFTKAHKLHCMPILPCLREPLAAYVADRPRNAYLFADAPRPSNPKLRVAHEASKWFGRFFAKHKIDRVFHELRDTWIEAAKHSPVERDIWEIISGHSAATVSDRYGGKKPDVLAAANEKVCELLTDDPEVKAAMLRLVS